MGWCGRDVLRAFLFFLFSFPYLFPDPVPPFPPIQEIRDEEKREGEMKEEMEWREWRRAKWGGRWCVSSSLHLSPFSFAFSLTHSGSTHKWLHTAAGPSHHPHTMKTWPRERDSGCMRMSGMEGMDWVVSSLLSQSPFPLTLSLSLSCSLISISYRLLDENMRWKELMGESPPFRRVSQREIGREWAVMSLSSVIHIPLSKPFSFWGLGIEKEKGPAVRARSGVTLPFLRVIHLFIPRQASMSFPSALFTRLASFHSLSSHSPPSLSRWVAAVGNLTHFIRSGVWVISVPFTH